MRLCLILLTVVALVCPAFAALDSATIINGGNITVKLAEIIANLTGHGNISSVIAVLWGAIAPVIMFLFGHFHGVKATNKANAAAAAGAAAGVAEPVENAG
jgi:hypothetical protein